jgi:hypothetical protein
MSLQIDFTLIPNNFPSICIPYVFGSITDSRIMDVFRDLDYGWVERIEKVPYTAKDGRKVNRVFIHLNWKKNNYKIEQVRADLLSGREITIMYDNPWFWRISANRAEKQKPEKQSAPRLPLASPLQSAPRLPLASPLQSAPRLQSASPLQTALPLQSAPRLQSASPLHSAPSFPLLELSLEPLQMDLHEYLPTTPNTSPPEDEEVEDGCEDIDSDDSEYNPRKITRNSADIDYIKDKFNAKEYIAQFPSANKLPQRRNSNKKF